MPASSGARDTVDQFDSRGLESGEVALDVVGPVGDMMERWTTPAEEPADAGFKAQGFEELDETDERDSNALGLEGLGVGTAFARQEFEETATLFDRVDGDRHVVDGAVHFRDISHRRMLHSVHNGDKERCNANE